MLRNRDGLLNEAERMKLHRHLEQCEPCALYLRELESSLDLLQELPEMELSENFDWNLKRRIALEKSKLMRNQAGPVFGDFAWGSRFVTAAAATLVVVLAGAWFFFQGERFTPRREPMVVESATRPAPRELNRNNIFYTSQGYPGGIELVSDNPFEDYAGRGQYSQQPFSVVSQQRVDYLIRENTILRQSLQVYKEQNAQLRKLLQEERARR